MALEKFPTSVSVEELHGLKFKEDPPKTHVMRFLVLWVPLGALAGFLACMVEHTGAMFFPVWGVVSLFLWLFDPVSDTEGYHG